MEVPLGIERRDPASGLIRLGLVLSHLQKQRQSGDLRVADQGRIHLVRLFEGHISGILFDDDDDGKSVQGKSWSAVPDHLFTLVRPQTVFEEKTVLQIGTSMVPADRAVLRGVVKRQDLFNPRPLAERIPVETLRLDREMLLRLMTMGLSDDEVRFVIRLEVPTPVTMALWKRGLSPDHAGALLVALNVLGCFAGWAPGDLPRISAVTQLLRKIRARKDSHQILGVSESASMAEIDRAFRKLSFELHPDRLSCFSFQERQEAMEAFESVTAAHAELKFSRRSPKVRVTRTERKDAMSAYQTESWNASLSAARNFAAAGLHKQAATSVLRALSYSPPPGVVAELKQILRESA